MEVKETGNAWRLLSECHSNNNLQRVDMKETTYYVPTTLSVLASSWFPPKILAVPKSDIFGFISLSNKTLLAFISRWMILSRESSCRYKRPLAVPVIMFARFAQSSSLLLFGSGFVKVRKHKLLRQWKHPLMYCYARSRTIGMKHMENLRSIHQKTEDRELTKQEGIKASVGQVLIDKKLFISFHAIS